MKTKKRLDPACFNCKQKARGITTAKMAKLLQQDLMKQPFWGNRSYCIIRDYLRIHSNNAYLAGREAGYNNALGARIKIWEVLRHALKEWELFQFVSKNTVSEIEKIVLTFEREGLENNENTTGTNP